MIIGWTTWCPPIAPASQAEELPADTPFMLVYTSGTSGKPKGTVHTHVSLPIKTQEDFQLCFDLKESDRMVWMTDMGWLVGPIQILATALAGRDADHGGGRARLSRPRPAVAVGRPAQGDVPRAWARRSPAC